MNLIIFGPPGSGKGTYAFRLQKPLNVAKISTGDMFREIAKQNTEFGKKIAGILNSGGLVSDEITVKMLKDRISQPDAKNGVILDGYPRTIEQAKILEKLLKTDAIINLIVPEKILIEKMSARRICKKCGNIYNVADIKHMIDGVEYILPPMLPKKEGVCDKCGGELYQRDDDNPKIIKDRLEVYEKQSEPVADYYKKKKVKFVNIHVTRPPEIMTEKILDELKKIGLLE